ncbi:hypothetical protein [Limnovirga soli]|uniref:DinB family protein n=1 Tax=Limnovirga soli TaxID=2656915 RepID=A0A8J8JT28_9BACT|nr:hypothetical protein [Limnovirga soli]NNV54199.1 hypothetical protein [Limnovirga soli]
MYKQHLINNIEKEINICRRLYTKIPTDGMNYAPGEGVRSILELLQYLSIAGTFMPDYWLNKNETDFGAFYGLKIATSKTMPHEQFSTVMDEQIIIIKSLFSQISEDDLLHKEVTYPWSGEKAPLGEAIIATSIKWLAAYKLQLFLYIKLSGNKQLATADAWALTDLSL